MQNSKGEYEDNRHLFEIDDKVRLMKTLTFDGLPGSERPGWPPVPVGTTGTIEQYDVADDTWLVKWDLLEVVESGDTCWTDTDCIHDVTPTDEELAEVYKSLGATPTD